MRVRDGICDEHARAEERARLRVDAQFQEKLDELNPLAAERRYQESRNPRIPTGPTPWTGDGSPYGVAAMRNILAELVQRAGEDGRNNALNRAAYATGRLVAGRELHHHAALHALREAGLRLGLPQREVESTVRSGFTSGLKKPRSAPPRRAA